MQAMAILVLFSTMLTASPIVSGAVTAFTNKTAWEAAAGPYSTITFSELPPLTWITDQYANSGLHFTDGSDQIYNSENLFSDQYGLNGAFDETTIEFDQPMTTLAMDFPGAVNFQLYWGGEVFYSGTIFGGSGTGHFVGAVSTQPFDKVFLYDPAGGLVIDNLYFGPPVPGPGALALFALATITNGRRRRS